MKNIDVRLLKIFLVLLSLVVVECYTPSHNNHQNNNNKGFGKNANSNDNDKKKKNGASTTTSSTATTTKSGSRYLEPFALELTTGDNDNDSDGGGGGERSVCTLTDRSAGDILLEIPLEDTITVERIHSRLSTCEKDNDDDEDEEEALAYGLLRLRYESLDPYVVDVLPKKHFNVWTLPGDLWRETSTVLPRCYSETFDATRQRVNKFATRIATKTKTTNNKNDNDNDNDNDNEKFTVEDALWAFSMVRSRSLAVPELNDEKDNDNVDGTSTSTNRMPLALIPGLDLFNHAFGSGTQLQLVVDDENDNNQNSKSKSKWVISSSDSIKAGEEVFLSYGDDKDNWKLLLTYGFTVPNNPNAFVFWSWRDLLDAAQKVRPNTFTDYACRQLLRHPQLEAYTVASENRATFSYDAQTNTPRESLSNGLTMLNSLAAQLGKPEQNESDNDSDSASLANQVLGELRRRRLDELRDGQNRLKDHQAERKRKRLEEVDSDEWKPFFESLRVALESEQRQLEAQTKTQAD